eukprot:gnl/TRDRNA2_/TRDRNA2_182376_c0_seq1.p1 gnl/TRDRNA2_/TRDRNA2_182376_c0~~gnl/TRDRNA2_/TRDRNA2_182376_c0_seq1.p1  ORF type:complete len:602 (+),score=79.72 gnl/TRDRNA2_/TRDRNA2_182376_c0_seq1:36-1841(+)
MVWSRHAFTSRDTHSPAANAANARPMSDRAAANVGAKGSSTPGRRLLSHFGESVQTARFAAGAVRHWIPGFLGRVTSKDALALGIDSCAYGVVQLPAVTLDRIRDLSGALLRANPRDLVDDPRGAVAQAAQRSCDVLGGGFVKIAQVIAHSPALFPQTLVRACQTSLAHATTTPTSPEDVERMVINELAVSSLGDMFDVFELHPMASASIAQVHRARLLTGEECVVKLVRPKVKERLSADFQALLLLARLGDLVLGEEVTRLFVNRPLEACIDELHQAVMAECNLCLERQNMEHFRAWVQKSPTLRRMGLEGSVFTPQTYGHASGEKVLTMDFVRGPTLSELSTDSDQKSELWQPALVRALTVAALSIVDGPAMFHADLHSGNMIMVPGPSNSFDRVAFIDFGCCGRLPLPLRSCLMMQASAFLSEEPDCKQFTRGFAHALDRIPGLGPTDLNVDALAVSLTPLLKEMQSKNPFAPDANPMDPELHMLAFRLQMLLCNHGVQLPAEFTLLLKTACFGALYFSLLDDEHRDKLLSQLAFSGAAYSVSYPREACSTLSLPTLRAFAKVLWANRKSKLRPRQVLVCATTGSVPLGLLAAWYFSL